MEIKTINNKKDFFALKEDWNGLLKRSCSENIFLTWEWMYCWWDVFGKNKQLFIIVFKEKGKIVGISPTYTENFFSSKIVKFIGDEVVDSNYLDFITDKKLRSKILIEFIAILNDTGLLYLKYLDSKNDLLTSLKKTNQVHKFTLSETHGTYLPNNLEEFVSSLSTKERKRLKNAESKIFRNFAAEMITSSNNIEDVIYINKKRWKKEKLNFSSHQILFLKKILNLCSKTGFIELLYLKLDGKNIAYEMNFIFNKTKCVYSAAFDLDFVQKNKLQNYSFGSALHFINFKRSVENRLIYHDMLRGNQAYKAKISNNKRTNIGIFSYKKNQFYIFAILLLFTIKLTLAAQKFVPQKFHNIIMRIIPKKILSFLR